LTAQQRRVVECMVRGLNVRILAHAGTGKTRTVMCGIRAALAAAPEKRALFVAYNRSVKEEVREHFGADARVKVHSYDSALTEFYDSTAPTTNFQLALHRLLAAEESQPTPVRREAEGGEGLRFDVLVVDEAQDLDESYLRLLRKMLRDNARSSASVVAVGDPKQGIYEYRGASARFFLRDDQLFAGLPVETLALFEVFRFQNNICYFVNRLFSKLFEADRETHWPHRHVPASDERRPDPQVLRYVLPASETIPDALLSRLASLRAVVLVGSRKESNRDLWRVMEQLQDWEPGGRRHLVTELPECKDDPNVTVFVTNVHPSKGQTFRNVALFLTNERTWLKRGGAGVNPEILYVALTRCSEQLIVVESVHSLLLQRVVEASLGGGEAAREKAVEVLPPARCAQTGLLLDVWLREQPRGPQRRTAPRPDTLADFVERDMEASALGALYDLLETDEASELWADEDGPDRVEAIATWARHDWKHSLEGRFTEFLRALGGGPEHAYAQLCEGLAHLLTPRLREVLLQVATTEPGAWGWQEWLQVARFHPDFHYGHSYVPHRPGRLDRLESLWRQLQATYAAHCGRKPSSLWYPLKREYGLNVYVSRDRDESYVQALVLEGTQAPRPVDHLVAAAAAQCLGKETYRLHYLSVGRVVEGRLPAANRESFRAGFRREIDRCSLR